MRATVSANKHIYGSAYPADEVHHHLEVEVLDREVLLQVERITQIADEAHPPQLKGQHREHHQRPLHAAQAIGD